MARRVYACKDKGHADKSFRTSSRMGNKGVGKPNSATKGFRPSQETRIVYLSSNVPAHSIGTPMTQITGQQTVHLNTSTGNYSTTSLLDGSTLPTISFYNPIEEAFSSGDYIIVHKWQGTWWVQGSHGPPATGSGVGYGALTSALADTDATASITLDASSPFEPSTAISATNWCGMDGSVGAKAIVAKQGTEYILIQLSCPAP